MPEESMNFSNGAEKKKLNLYGRDNLLVQIKEYVVGHDGVPENVALLGLKGIGKTALIDAAFDDNQLNLYLKEHNIIVSRAKTSYDYETMQNFYSYLSTSILNSMEILENLDPEKYKILIERIKDMQNKMVDLALEVDEALKESVLSKTVDIIRNMGYKILLLFDDFDRFAGSTMLKNNQYKYMRDLANSGRISLLIATSQDLTKVSEEIVGSGFENIFIYEELKGIRYEYFQEWMLDFASEANTRLEEDVIDWCYETSGGIPELVKATAEAVIDIVASGEEIDKNDCLNTLMKHENDLLRNWWQQLDFDEKSLLKKFINEEIGDSIVRDRLIKKGYLIESDNDKISFCSPLFELYILDIVIDEENHNSAAGQKGNNSDFKIIGEQLKKVIETNDHIDKKVQDIEEQMANLSNMIDKIVLPSKSDFYNEDSGELESEEYLEAIQKTLNEQEFFSSTYNKIDSEKICNEWNISSEIWNTLTDVQKQDCKLAFVLSYIFGSNEELAYDPITVTLGNFLESILIDWLLPVFKKYEPAFYRTEIIKGNEKPTIGTFYRAFNKSSIILDLTSAGCNGDKIKSYCKRLEVCLEIRNNTDHHGINITFEQEQQFIKNLFQSKNNILNVTKEFSAL